MVGSEDETEALPPAADDWTAPSLGGPIEATRPILLAPTGVDVGPTLARGGMAVVHLGHQRKLGRSVAVKTLRSGEVRDFERLVREAKLMSRLEHPNILPVHDIFVDDEGMPQVVLKLIEGDTWSDVMGDEDAVLKNHGAVDLLEWNLDVLKQVCRAVSFAHSHGVIHRDIKPANVMVGRFGEVYLLDWGIAQETDKSDTDVGPLPADEIAGTMVYMAPEQLEGEASRIGPWTDVYLLGATLFHVLTGEAPHKGVSREQRILWMLDGIAKPPYLPEDIPIELRRIVTRSMDPDFRKRFDSAEGFRKALVDFTTHRAAARFVERGDAERLLAEEAWHEGDHGETLRHLLAADLAYGAALAEWPGSPDAAVGAAELITLRVQHALATGEPRRALRLVQAHDLEGELAERARQAVDDAEREEERLRGIAADSDLGIGHRTRGVLGALIALGYLVFWTYVAFRPPDTVMPLVVFSGACMIVAAIVVTHSARVLLKTRLNRTVLTVHMSLMLIITAWCAGGGAMGLAVQQIQIVLLLVWGLGVGAIASVVHPLGLPSGAAFLIAFGLASWRPEYTPWVTLGAGIVTLLNQVLLNVFVTGRSST